MGRFVHRTFGPLVRFFHVTLCLGTLCPWDVLSVHPIILLIQKSKL